MRIGSLKRWWMHYSFWCEKQVFIFYIALIMCNFWGNLVLGHNFEFICNFFGIKIGYLFLELILGTKMMDLFWVKLYIVPRPGWKHSFRIKYKKKFVKLFFWSKNLVITYYFVVDVVIVLALHLKNLSDIWNNYG